jgi:uncharacterized protein
VQLTQDNFDVRYVLRSADGDLVRVNELELRASFFLTPDELVTGWAPRSASSLEPADLDPLIARGPAVVLLGSGARLQFPAPDVMAACLTRGIGIEVMDNAAAARTFNLLANEGRRVLAAFLL